MDLRRRLEVICGLITAVMGIIVVLGALHEAQLIAQTLQEPAPIGRAFVVSFLLYGLPTLLVAMGGYTHAMRRQSWGRALLITASVFLMVWFLLSLVVVVWSGWLLPMGLLTGFALLTSIISLLVRREV